MYEKYINPVAETFAWVLMVNHFHLAVRIRDEEEISMTYEFIVLFHVTMSMDYFGSNYVEMIKNIRLQTEILRY